MSATDAMPAASGSRKRLGVFLAYDADGILDDYVFFLLREIRPSLARLIIMVNGRLTDESLAKLREISDDIHLRPNQGFDVGAWREGILTHCGFGPLRHYDELVLFNDSFFGPFRPFSEIFDDMDRRNVDFWGLSVHGEATGTGLCPYGYRPRYLQTYFLVFGKRMLLDPVFQSFWETLPEFRHFEEVSERFSAVLTRYFADLGYSWAAFSDTSDLETRRDQNFDHHTHNVYEMVAHREYPVIKRRSFLVPKETYLRFGSGDGLRNALEYVRNRYDYDLRLIFGHLLRKHGAGTLKDALSLNYVLPVGGTPTAPFPTGKKIAIVAHLFYPDLFPYCVRYLRNVPPGADVFVTTDTEEKQREIQRLLADTAGRHLTVLRVEPRGRDWAALLAGCKGRLTGYDYLGFVHDKKSLQKEYPTVGTSFRDMLWENMLASGDYVRGVVATFEAHPELGLLVPPGPVHGTYFKSGMDRWTICYDETCRLAKKLGIQTRLGKTRQPLAVGSVFWCRTDALQPLLAFDWNHEDFPPEPLANDGTLNHALERILPYAAQSRGYLTGWVMTTRQAEVEIANLRHMLDETRSALNGTPGVRFTTFAAFRRSLATLRRTLRLTGLGGPLRLFEKAEDWVRRHGPHRIRKWITQLRLRRAKKNPSREDHP